MDVQVIGEFVTQDMGVLDPTGALHIHGRRDTAITLQGETIHLEVIERCAETHRDVQEAVCVAVLSSDHEAPILCLFVRSLIKLDDICLALIKHIARHFSNLCIPQHVFSLPKHKGLKPSREALLKQAQEQLLL